jgi:VanZ family protein
MSVSSGRTAPYLLFAYALIVAFASLNPLSGWRDTGISPWAFMADPWPRYLTRFDWTVNVAAYVPLGFLALLALPAGWSASKSTPRLMLGGLLALAACSGFSWSMEAAQTYLPMRVPAISDWLANTIGAAIGAVAAGAMAALLARRPAWQGVFSKLFVPHAGPIQTLVGLWMVAQLHPVSASFVTGRFVPELMQWAGSVAGMPVQGQFFDASAALSAEQFTLLEAVAGGTGLISLLALGRLVLQPEAPRFVMLLLLLAGAMAAKSIASMLQFGPGSILEWWTDGARGAVMIAALAAVPLAVLPRVWAMLIGVGALMLLLALANAIPDNPYFAATLTRWHEGRFINFFGLTQGLAAIWPFAAMAVLTLRTWKKT